MWTALAMVGSLALAARAGEPGKSALSERVEQDGFAVEATVSHVAAAAAGEQPLRSSDAVRVRFRLSDQTGQPLTGAFPLAWMVLRGRPGGAADDAELRCRVTLQRLQTSSLREQAEVDLNGYLLLALNEDATISVIDPLTGFAGTHLIGLPQLDGVGEDWVEIADLDRLAVSVPDAGVVDILDTRSWDAPVRRLALGATPRRLSLQPDRAFLWIEAVDAATGAATAVAVNPETLDVAGRVPLGQGPHELAFTADSRLLFVANAGSGSVTVIDVGTLAPIAHIVTGPRPVSLAYSTLANAVYVADGVDGSVTVIDATSHAVRTRIAGIPGLGQVRFAPGGRFALAVNTQANTVVVIDSSLDRAIASVDVPQGPDQVTFTGAFAYVRQSASSTVLMLPLDKLAAGEKVPVLQFPGGNAAPGATVLPSPAPGIVPAPGEGAVMAANAGDREIYYYQEGMAAPMGSFSNYKRQPRAVMVVRRDLREREPGVYETTAQLGRPGSYDLVLRLDQPRLHHCFSLAVAPATDAPTRQPPQIAPVGQVGAVSAGRPIRLGFVITDAAARPVADLNDVTVLVMAPSWQARKVATALGDGRYDVDFVVPVPGFYAVMVRSAAVGLDYQPMPGLTVTAAP